MSGTSSKTMGELSDLSVVQQVRKSSQAQFSLVLMFLASTLAGPQQLMQWLLTRESNDICHNPYQTGTIRSSTACKPWHRMSCTSLTSLEQQQAQEGLERQGQERQGQGRGQG